MKHKNFFYTFFFITLCSACSTTPESSSTTSSAELNSNAKTCTSTFSTAPAPIRYEYKKGEVLSLCEKSISNTETKIKAIVALKPEERNIKNTLLAYESAIAGLLDETGALYFMGYVSTNEALSAEGTACDQKMTEYLVDVTTRRDIYNVLAAQKTDDKNEKRLLTETLKAFEENGLKLNDSDLAEVKKLMIELENKKIEFTKNLNNDTSTVTFSREELAGVPDSFFERLKKTEDGNYIVTTKTTDYWEVMENASSAETRKRMLTAYLDRAAVENTKLLNEILVLRQTIAKKMGFANWADYRTKNKMSGSSQKVWDFLNNLKNKLAKRNQQDVAQLLEFKKELIAQNKISDSESSDPAQVQVWDLAYLTYQYQKQNLNLDNEKIREYFPAESVIAGIFDIYSKLLGVTFVEVENAKTWADGVKLYEIHNTDTCEHIAYFYTDLAPRPGKYGHAAAFPLILGRIQDSGKYSRPVSSIVANFTPPSGDKPALLTHEEVETFFHEFGHIMHQTLTRAPYASLSGSWVAKDFSEAPSQMLENWIWDEKILERISSHYKNPNEKLPKEILQKLIKAKKFQQASLYTKQLVLASFDMTLHTSNETLDVDKTYNDIYRSLMGVEPLAGNHFAAGFGHLMGYDAGYYGYLWSEVFAQDMFTKFPKTDLTDSSVGARYRQIILEQGNMKDASVLLKEFLGRDPNTEAFFADLGIE